MPASRLALMLRTRPPRLNEEEFTKELCDFVEFVAQTDPEQRPTAKQILEHPYIRGTEATYPVALLKDLVDKFVDWSFTGGQRTSLFFPTGAQAASEFVPGNSDEVDFIFSTSRDFTSGYDAHSSDDFGVLPSSEIDSPPSFSFPNNLEDFATDPPDFTARPNEINNKTGHRGPSNDANNERRVVRGGQALGALFDAKQHPYEYGVRSGEMPLDKPILSRAKSDLPLRNHSDDSDLARMEVDYYETSGSKSDVELADADTIKSKRKHQVKEKRETMNMGWQPDWGDVEDNTATDTNTMPHLSSAYPIRPALIHAETAPDRVAMARASTATINLDDLMGDDDWQSGSAVQTSGLVTPAEDHFNDVDFTTRHNITNLNDSDFHSYASSLADVSASEDETYVSPRTIPRQSARKGIGIQEHPNMWVDVAPPSAAAMRDDAPPEVVSAELSRLLGSYASELRALKDEMPKGNDLADNHDGESGEGEFRYEALDDYYDLHSKVP